MDKVKNRLIFEVGGVKLYVKKPTIHQKKKADLVYAKAFREALEGGAILRESLEKHKASQDVDSVEKQKEMYDLLDQIQKDRLELEKEGLDPKEGEAIAHRILLNVAIFRLSRNKEINLDSKTAEAFADDEKFHYLVSVCTFKEDGNYYFSGLNEYFERSEDEITMTAATKFSHLFYGLEENEEENRPENKYLKKLELSKEEVVVEEPKTEEVPVKHEEVVENSVNKETLPL